MDSTLTILLSKHQPKQDEIQADPWQVIPIKNIKVARQTTQIHLGNRQANKLANFSSFPNLEILWLNNNQLTSLSGLQSNFRIKHLFIQNNKINNIDGIFVKLKHIETLVAYDNQLRDLDKILKHLSNLKSLQQLDLFKNPASFEPNYKFRVIYAIQSLDIFDRHKLLTPQKMEAISFMTTRKQSKSSKKPFT